MFRVLGFSDLDLLWCLPSFLGVGLGKRMQKQLGAHQERLNNCSEREHS
jgi:hypothetical protein